MKNDHKKAELFNSSQVFRQAFEQGLVRLLDQGGLNLFILVAVQFSPRLS